MTLATTLLKTVILVLGLGTSCPNPEKNKLRSMIISLLFVISAS